MNASQVWFDPRTLLAAFLYGSSLWIILWRDPLGISPAKCYSSKTDALMAMLKSIVFNTVLSVICVCLEVLFTQAVITLSQPKLLRFYWRVRPALHKVRQELSLLVDAASVFLLLFYGHGYELSRALDLIDITSSPTSQWRNSFHKCNSLTLPWTTDSSTPPSPRLSTALTTPSPSPPVGTPTVSFIALDLHFGKPGRGRAINVDDGLYQDKIEEDCVAQCPEHRPNSPKERTSGIVAQAPGLQVSRSESQCGSAINSIGRRRKATFFLDDDPTPPQTPLGSSTLSRSRSLCTLHSDPPLTTPRIQSILTALQSIGDATSSPTRLQPIKPFKGAVMRSPSLTPSNPWAKSNVPPVRISHKARFRAKERDRRRLTMTPITTTPCHVQEPVDITTTQTPDTHSISNSIPTDSPCMGDESPSPSPCAPRAVAPSMASHATSAGNHKAKTDGVSPAVLKSGLCQILPTQPPTAGDCVADPVRSASAVLGFAILESRPVRPVQQSTVASRSAWSDIDTVCPLPYDRLQDRWHTRWR